MRIGMRRALQVGMGNRVAVSAVVAAALAFPALGGQQAARKDESQQEPVKVERKTRVRLGGVSVGAGYSRYSGPLFYPYAFMPYYWNWYSPAMAFYDPFWYGPGFYPWYARGPNTGSVKLRAEPADAEVYIDGAYAGRALDLKTMTLEPGAYNLEVRSTGREPFTKRIYVLTGNTLKIDARLAPAGTEKTP